jgi:3-oxoacyl-[acyl-carrier protein] reductase
VLHVESLAGRTALVTGAASGIGRATAVALAREGVAVVCLDRDDAGDVARAIAAAGGRAAAQVGSITDEDAVAAAVGLCTERFAPLTIVVNAAGVVDYEPLEQGDVSRWMRQIAVNLVGPMAVLKHAVPVMREQGGGAAILFGSVAGKTGGIRSGPAYGASKGGVHALVRWAAHAYAEDAIRVNAIAPGPVDTPMTQGRGYTPDSVPLGRLGDPAELAEAVVFLASEAGAWMTGQTLNVNGGVFMQ